LDPIDKLKVDRTCFDTVELTHRTSDVAYWRSRTPAERFEALEILRQIAYGYDPTTERLSEFLRLLNSNAAEYLLIGGYAVNYYGCARSIGDLDIWM
jgi:hypothetical protein